MNNWPHSAKKMTRRLLIAALLFMLTGCAALQQLTREDNNAPPPGRTGSVEAIEFDLASAMQPARLTLEPDDSVRISILGYPELAGSAQIQKDGSISLPVIGELHAAGSTIQELRQEVEARFESQLKPRPVQLRLGDSVRLSVWRHPDLSADATVISDGSLTYPLVGRLQAEGLTLDELTQQISDRLSDYVRNPRVALIPLNFNRDMLIQPRISLTLERMRARNVAVLGEVNAPGLRPMQGAATRVMDVLAQANHRNSANLNSVLVIRKHAENKPAYRVLRLGDYMDGKAMDQNIYLQPEDIIIVPKTTIAKVGEFIDQFFARTRPVFDWWIALQQARFAEDSARSIRLYNDYLDTLLP